LGQAKQKIVAFYLFMPVRKNRVNDDNLALQKKTFFDLFFFCSLVTESFQHFFHFEGDQKCFNIFFRVSWKLEQLSRTFPNALDIEQQFFEQQIPLDVLDQTT
jgi:hypothetical protein